MTDEARALWSPLPEPKHREFLELTWAWWTSSYRPGHRQLGSQAVLAFFDGLWLLDLFSCSGVLTICPPATGWAYVTTEHNSFSRLRPTNSVKLDLLTWIYRQGLTFMTFI